MLRIQETPLGVTLEIKVQPRAKRNAIWRTCGALKMSLTAPPLDGRANAACIEFLAEILDIACASITLISRQSSRSKLVRVSGMDAAGLSRRLELPTAD